MSWDSSNMNEEDDYLDRYQNSRSKTDVPAMVAPSGVVEPSAYNNPNYPPSYPYPSTQIPYGSQYYTYSPSSVPTTSPSSSVLLPTPRYSETGSPGVGQPLPPPTPIPFINAPSSMHNQLPQPKFGERMTDGWRPEAYSLGYQSRTNEDQPFKQQNARYTPIRRVSPPTSHPLVQRRKSSNSVSLVPDHRALNDRGYRSFSSAVPPNVTSNETYISRRHNQLALTAEEELLLDLRARDNPKLDWKTTQSLWNEKTGKNQKIPALQMRHWRLRERLRVWNEKDVRSHCSSRHFFSRYLGWLCASY